MANLQADLGSYVNFALPAPGETSAKQPTIDTVAYTGGKLLVGEFYFPVVVDLKGLRAQQSIAHLFRHDPDKLVGQSDKIKISKSQITSSGKMTGDPANPDDICSLVATHARNGYRWGASIGVKPDVGAVDYIDEKSSVTVNGQKLDGPLTVIRSGRLGEISIVPIGADENASVTVAASAPSNQEISMKTFEEWLKANGFEDAELSEEGRKVLRASYDAEVKAQEEAAKPKTKPKKTAAAPVAAEDPPADPGEVAIEAAATAADFVAEITAACEGHPELLAQALRQKWTKDRCKSEIELKTLRASRPAFSGIRTGACQTHTPLVLEAALRLGGTEKSASVEKDYQPEVLEPAHKMRRMGLRALIEACCSSEGIPVPSLSASIDDWVRAGFSTTSLAGILGSTLNKIMLASFQAEKSKVQLLFKKLTANNFNTHTGYKLGGATRMDEVGSDGELKHGTLEQTAFPFQASTYGKLLGITRQQWMNDDAGALGQIPQLIGRGAVQAIERVGWLLVVSNPSSFFAAGHGNYAEGAGSVLGKVGLDAAVVLMRAMTDGTNGEPVDVEPRFLVVPPALEGAANEFFKAQFMIMSGLASTSAASRMPASNIYQGRFEPVVVSRLSSATAWYLWGDPTTVAPFGIAYVNGVDTPVIEEVASDPAYLGRVWRGYIDFGVCALETQGAVLSVGA